jgi:hypothetical protein
VSRHNSPPASRPGARAENPAQKGQGSSAASIESPPPLSADFSLADDGSEATIKVLYEKNRESGTRPAPEASVFPSEKGRKRLVIRLHPNSCVLKFDWLDGELVNVRVDGAFSGRAGAVGTTSPRVFQVRKGRNSVALNLDASLIPATVKFSDGTPVRIELDRPHAANAREAAASPDGDRPQGRARRNTAYELIRRDDTFVLKPRSDLYFAKAELDENGELAAIRIIDGGELSDRPRRSVDRTVRGSAIQRSPSFELRQARGGTTLVRLPTRFVTHRRAERAVVHHGSVAGAPAGQGPTLLFVVGPHKTFTSSLVGFLNACPDVFLLYETEPYAARPTKWALRLLENKPELRKCFAKGDEIERTYRTLYQHLCVGRSEFLYFGDKIATIDDSHFDLFRKFKKIVTIRDLRTWLAKESIREAYALDADIVPAACQYVRFLIKSRLADDVLLITLEEAVENLRRQQKRISAFLGDDLNIPREWWRSVGEYDATDPKSLQPWWERHASSSVEAERLDIECQISSHPFWNAILPIFNKYYDRAAKTSAADAENDLFALAQVQATHELAWQHAFESVTEAAPV